MEILYSVSDEEKYRVGSFDFKSEGDDFCISLDPSLCYFKDISKIFNKADQDFFSEYKSLKDTLGLTNKELLGTIPTEKRNKYIEKKVNEVKDFLKNERDEEYVGSYASCKSFLRNLKKPDIDLDKVRLLAKDIPHDHVAQRVYEFGKSTKQTRYSMSGTVTGRLVVTEGPNILTLPASVRSCIRSKYERGKVLQIDLVSAEPHLALLMVSKEVPKDIYSHISEKVLENSVSRSQSKLVTLSSLYGQSASNLKKSLPDHINARDVIKKTKEYFHTDKLRSMLLTQIKTDRFRNVLGRPIFLEESRKDLIISYFLQSSIAELSLVLFSKFSRERRSVIPYYMIHDALIFDADETTASDLLASKVLDIEYGGWKFQAKVTCLDNI